MKRVFLDTNILIDYIQARAGGDDAKQLLMRGLDGEVRLYANIRRDITTMPRRFGSGESVRADL